jgi:hypothetical protein
MDKLPIDSLLRDLPDPIGGTIVTWIIDSEDPTPLTASQQNPVTAIVDISDDSMTLRETIADFTLGGDLHATIGGDTKGINFSPAREELREGKPRQRRRSYQ